MGKNNTQEDNTKVLELKEILQQFDSTTKELLQLLSSFNQQQVNTAPFEGSWTAAQIGEHLHKSYKGLPRILTKGVKPTERDPAEHIAVIRKTFLDFNTKLKSPEFIIPENKTYNKETLVNELQNLVPQIRDAVQSGDINETCTGFAFPVLGELTRLEIIHFVVYHTRRHNRQLKNILEKVVADSAM